MIIDSALVKQLRANKQWTQEQLAEVCGVSLRTIQRLESSGSASNETVRALASVFGVRAEELIVEQGADSEQATEKAFSPASAVLDGFKRYADVTGTSSREEYWWFFLCVLIVLAIAFTVNYTLFTVISIVVAVPLVTAGARRLNETGESGWWQLLALVPFGIFVVMYLLAIEKASAKGPVEN